MRPVDLAWDHTAPFADFTSDEILAKYKTLPDLLAAFGFPTQPADAVDLPFGKLANMVPAGARSMLAEVVEGLVKRIPNPIKAYHGSPHDFDRFSIQKIGTGEGAQAYGHGLYFAESEDTARYYKDELQSAKRRTEPVMYNGQEVPMGTGLHPLLVDVAERGKAATISDLERSIGFNRANDYAPDMAALQEHYLEKLRGIDESKLVVPKGRMYEVAIHADPESLLDWDKPLSEQSGRVRQALEAVPSHMRDKWKETGAWPHVRGRELYQSVARANATPGAFPEILVPRPARASSALADAGVGGIKYLDQGSRTAGAGTSNYVMFDDALIEILRKYGLLPAAVMGGMASHTQTGEQ